MARLAVRAVGFLLAAIVALIALAVAAVVVISVFVGWGAFKEPLANAVSGAIGRKFAINGPLDVDLGRVTRVHMSGVTLENADWAKQPENMVEIKAVDVGIDVFALLKGDIVVDALHVDTPKVSLTKNQAGEANWQFAGKQEEEPAPPAERQDLPIVRDLTVKDAALDYEDRKSGNEVSLTLATLAGASTPDGVRVSGEGTYQDQPLALDVEAGSLDALRSEGEAYPINIDIASEAISAKVEGTVSQPQTLQGLDVQFAVKGNNLADLYTLAGVPVPPSPPYSLKGQLTRDGSAFKLADFAGKLGESDLSGTAAVDTGGERLKATADLVSHKFDFDDIAVLMGGKREEEKQAEAQREAKGEPTSGKVLPDKPINLSALREIDADVRIKAGQVLLPGVPIDGLEGEVTLDAGVLRLSPMTVEIGQGTINTFMTLDGTVQPARADIDTRISRVDLKRLLSKSPFAQESAGHLGGRAKLATTGNSVAEILGSATGDLFVVMSGGRISHLLIELAGLDIAQSLGVAVSGDKPIPIRCMIGDFKANDGVFAVKTMVFDTTDTKIVGEGQIDMGEETLNLRLVPYPKDFSPLSMRTPLAVQGTLGNPQAMTDPIGIGVEGTVKKVVNAVLTPIVGLAPPIDEGVGEDSDCAQLIADAKQAGAD
ncbi:MAG: AsmA family protein [Rhodospirillales bacterium]|nr:AsmA family protein [Rhodospirillales bacterium]